MTKTTCPQCECADIQIRETNTFCPECSFTESTALDAEAVLIPKWVVAALEPTPDLLRDVSEINSGMYGPGYKSVVKLPEAAKTAPSRKITWKNPSRIAAAKQLNEARGVQLPARLPFRLPVNF